MYSSSERYPFSRRRGRALSCWFERPRTKHCQRKEERSNPALSACSADDFRRRATGEIKVFVLGCLPWYHRICCTTSKPFVIPGCLLVEDTQVKPSALHYCMSLRRTGNNCMPCMHAYGTTSFCRNLPYAYNKACFWCNFCVPVHATIYFEVEVKIR